MYKAMGILGALGWALRCAGKGENAGSEEDKDQHSNIRQEEDGVGGGNLGL